jgi:cytidine deaminase
VSAGGPSPSDDELAAAALAARAAAYAPYSGYQVGCALVAAGRISIGANVENASYGLAICAERNAVSRAVIDGARSIEVVAVATQSSPPASPCGMCLQTLLEFADDPAAVRVLLVNPAGERRAFTLAELIPHGFVKGQLDT